eukprot:7359459-Alexandrium_andersonii.AAC.1
MSASLVGSEMCIRDRLFRGLPAPRDLVQELARRESWDVRAALRLPRVPVSYTHLTLPTICSV